MQLTSIQVAGLQAHADAIQGVPDQSSMMIPSLRIAFALGKVYGKAELAQELLQEDAHRKGTPSLDCDLTGAARR